MNLDSYTTIILAGGFGTRIAEYSDFIPKPLVPIGNKPIISHIIDIYATQGVKKFIIAGGYRVDELKKYFSSHYLLSSDFTVDTKSGDIKLLNRAHRDVTITIVDTGLNTQTGGRLKRLENIIDQNPFFVTYGDGVSNVDLRMLIEQHHRLKTFATLTAVHPTSRYGKINTNQDGIVEDFIEKPEFGEDWINGGFMLMEHNVFEYLTGDDDVLEVALLQKLSKIKKLGALKHTGFWKSMDTLRDKRELDVIAQSKALPWMDI